MLFTTYLASLDLGLYRSDYNWDTQNLIHMCDEQHKCAHVLHSGVKHIQTLPLHLSSCRNMTEVHGEILFFLQGHHSLEDLK